MRKPYLNQWFPMPTVSIFLSGHDSFPTMMLHHRYRSSHRPGFENPFPVKIQPARLEYQQFSMFLIYRNVIQDIYSAKKIFKKNMASELLNYCYLFILI